MRNQKGTAIFTALFITALVSAIAIALAAYQRVDIHRTEQLVRSAEIHEYSQGAIYWAIAVLKNPSLKPDDESTKWPIAIPTTLIQQGQATISADLEYMNKSRFNLNKLADNAELPNFIELLNNTQHEFPQGWAEEVVKHIQAWITKAESPYEENYLAQNPPYRMAHQPMLSVAEFRLIEGVDAKQFNVLEPLLIAYEVDSGQYFLLRSQITLRDQELQTFSLLQRSESSGKVSVSLVWQMIGSY